MIRESVWAGLSLLLWFVVFLRSQQTLVLYLFCRHCRASIDWQLVRVPVSLCNVCVLQTKPLVLLTSYILLFFLFVALHDMLHTGLDECLF